ncbi:hypothetical protein A2310_04005 [candidate division WOR-1 bacterium RIFOXYB2_FULL_37_13]|uniref:Uncharacterized protein n=1 Tax=candidate division WOR-1 bacterium RIFOXYB2_FULL_37_13 TaxID=1802579 RepID=A0A1F4SNB3_UNCSA|nr:MAG: hypothetical protein A2310_04005 [candidate division WOR-1 bacterium RIFOXYB2_FULL_37_13]
MDIILRVINRSTKKELFIDNNLKIYDKEEVLLFITQQKINNLSLAKRNGKTYIKSKPNAKTTDNIFSKSISSTELISFYKNYTKAITDKNIKKYDDVRRKQQKKNFITIKDDKGDFVSTKTDNDIKNHLKKYKGVIFKAAREQKIDPFLLGAILIDEYCRMGWDDWLDWLGALNIKDTSVGIAQIKLSTAREILKKCYYNPAPGQITHQSPSMQIWLYLNRPEHSIQFSAAVIKLSIVYWQKKKIDISKETRVLAYLYSYGYTKDIKRAKVKRCIQISVEFYQMAKSILL